MEAGNVNAITKPYKMSVPRKHLKPQRIKAEPMPEKSFNNGGDTIQKCIRNSKNVKSEDISGEYERMAQFNATSSWVENQQAMEVADCRKVDAGPENSDEKPTPLAIDPNALVGDEENIYEPVVQDEQEPTKRRNNSENPVQGSRFCEQETYAQLEAKIKKLKKENSTSCHNMQEISVSCAQLRRENHRLLKKLKKVCAPDTIAYLEGRNPDNKVTIRDHPSNL